MFKLNRLTQSLVMVGLVLPVMAYAQDVPAAPKKDEAKPQRIEVTGSSIKRVRDEGAVPLQVIQAQDLVKQGITSAEQFVATLSSNGNGIDNMTTNQGGDFLGSTADRPHNNGAAAASLRGLGAQYTLVLLNGRRLSTHGLNGTSVDLNSIPMAAVDRIEVLKDGASAIYGTDAIGGVINFILKRDYQGLEMTASADKTQHGGGDMYRLSVLGGVGDYEEDGYNALFSLTYDTNNRLRGSQRSFQNGYQPDRGLAPDTTGTPFATIGASSGTALSGYYTLPGDSTRYNKANLLALQGDCSAGTDMVAYRGDITGFNNNNKACAYDYGKQWSLMQPVDRYNLVSKVNFKLSPDHMLTAEVVASHTESAVEYTPIQITTKSAGALYPAYVKDSSGNLVRSPYYLDLTGLVPGFDNTKDELIRWRCLECGPRQQNTKTDAYRVLLGLEGVLAGDWDYKTGLSYAQSKADTTLGDGYMYQDKLTAAMATGLINPFLLAGQTQTAEAMALLNAAKAKGAKLYGGQASVAEFDATFSREIYRLPAGPMSMALGVDVRNEKYKFNESESSYPAINGVSAPASLDEASRDISAVFGELDVPLMKNLDLQAALRYDHYSDFGSTTNPKVALRWQPLPELAFRTSYSEGFHAPGFEQLYGGASTGQFNSDINDPVLCPNGGTDANACGIRPEIVTTSNPNLKPETSKQWSIGFVASPLPWLTSSVDFWNIEIDNKIAALSGRALMAHYDQYAQYVVRDADGYISQVNAPFMNQAGAKTRGVDLNLTANIKDGANSWVANFDGTYTSSYKSRFSASDPWTELVGSFGDAIYGYDLHVRWKHQASLTWSRGDWSVTGVQAFTGHYRDEVDGFGSGVTSTNAPTWVKSYTLYHLSATYTGFKDTSVTFGVKNLFDTKPSYSAHNVDNVAGAGWDGRVGDPRMRSFTLRVNHKF